MKSRLLSYLFVFAVLVSCQQAEPQKTYSIKLSDSSQSSILVSCDTAEKDVAFTSEQEWTASVSSDWVSASPLSGNSGTNRIKIKVSENTSEDSRTASVKLVSGTASQTVSITQKAKGVLVVNTEEFSVDASACSLEVEVYSNLDYSVTIAADSRWISYGGTKAATTSRFLLNVQKNEDLAARTGTVTVSDDSGLSATITINQASGRSMDFDESAIVLSLGVVSDVHINNGNQDGGEVAKFKSALNQIKTKSAVLDQDGLDAVLVCGDLIDSPSDSQIKLFKSSYESVLNPVEFPMIYTIGNHDVPGYAWASSVVNDSRYIRNTLGDNYFKTDLEPQMGLSEECRHCKIGDYHILSISPNSTCPIGYTSTALNWLDNSLKTLTEEDPNRYVIVLTHPMIARTVYGSLLGEESSGIWYSSLGHYWSTSALSNILAKYPQSVVFGGHLHFPLNDPRSIWQGAFTVCGTGSVRYMAIENGGYQYMASATTMQDRAQFSQGYVLQFDKNGNLRFHRMDFLHSSTIGANDWTISFPVANKTHLRTYNHDELAMLNKAPTLSSLTAGDVEEGVNAKVSWAAGEDDEFVHHYVLTLKKGSSTIKTFKYLTDFYLHPLASDMKKTWEADFGELELGEYTVTLDAYDSWDAKASLTTDFKVAKPTPAELAVYADIQFNADGTMTDIKDKVKLTSKAAVIGPKSVSHNGKTHTVNALTASAGKYAVCEFKEITTTEQMKSFATGSFTVESFYVDAEPGSSAHGIVCGTEYGGWGLATSGSSYSNKPYFIAGSGASFNTFKSVYATAANPTDELTHVIAVYDYTNQKLRLYINGVLNNTAVLATPFYPGTGDCFNRFCIGNDIKQNNTGGDFPCSNAIIVSAKIYRGAMTDDNAAKAYQDAVKALGD